MSFLIIGDENQYDFYKKSTMASSACNACGTGKDAICCFGKDGSVLSGSCGNDGSFCSQATGNYCVTSSMEFGTPCSKEGDPCAIDNLTCQKDPNDNNSLKCLCKENFKPCDSKGTKMCDPGSSPSPSPSPSPPSSGKFKGDCTSDMKKAGPACPSGEEYMCFDGDTQTKGSCNPDKNYFNSVPKCNAFCKF